MELFYPEKKKGHGNPPIPAGFDYLTGTEDSGFVIQSEADDSQFVWIPVMALPKDGYLCARSPRSAFGSRNFRYGGTSRKRLPEELNRQYHFIKEYGGFYLARYSASRGEQGEPRFLPGEQPWTMINLYYAKKAAESYRSGCTVSAHLPYAAEMDSAIAWLLQTGRLTEAERKRALHVRDMMDAGRVLEKTGVWERTLDIVGNVDEWTQESFDEAASRCSFCVFPETHHCFFRPYSCYRFTGFRVALDIREDRK